MSNIKKDKIYLSNKDLYKEIVISKALGRLTPRAANMLMLLGKNVAKKMYYKTIDDRNDCLQEAMLATFKLWYNFDELKGTNAFSYYTEVIKRGLALGWNKMYKTKGEKVDIISLTGFDGEKSYDRF